MRYQHSIGWSGWLTPALAPARFAFAGCFQDVLACIPHLVARVLVSSDAMPRVRAARGIHPGSNVGWDETRGGVCRANTRGAESVDTSTLSAR